MMHTEIKIGYFAKIKKKKNTERERTREKSKLSAKKANVSSPFMFDTNIHAPILQNVWTKFVVLCKNVISIKMKLQNINQCNDFIDRVFHKFVFFLLKVVFFTK